jgi:hypothetical protein
LLELQAVLLAGLSIHLKGGVPCMKETQDKKTVKCEYCHKTVSYGRDVITVVRGVIGPRGVIALDEGNHFCSVECVSSYYDQDPTTNLPKLPPRIP